jgi:hypothetical protein
MDGVYAPETPPDHLKYDFIAINGKEVWGVIVGDAIRRQIATWKSSSEFSVKFPISRHLAIGEGVTGGVLIRTKDIPGGVLFKKSTQNLNPPEAKFLGKFTVPGAKKTRAWISGTNAELFINGASKGVVTFDQVTKDPTSAIVRMRSKIANIDLDTGLYNPTVVWTDNTTSATYNLVRTGDFTGSDLPSSESDDSDTSMALILIIVIVGILILNKR